MKPAKPSPDFPLFAHATKRWAKKIDGKFVYFGPWDDPQTALENYERHLRGEAIPPKAPPPRQSKPWPDFPLSLHKTGQWTKSIRGKSHYFGKDAMEALAKYRAQQDALHQGLEPPSDSLTLGDLCNECLYAKLRAVESGEITQRTYSDYKVIAKRIIDVLGRHTQVARLTPADFGRLRAAFAETHGPVSLANDITRARVFFKFGFDNHDIKPRYGSQFDKPTKQTLRLAREKGAKRLFTAEQTRKLIAEAKQPLKAMILLGINCGFGNNDCATLEGHHLDLDGGWHTKSRRKTGVQRKAPLWSETIEALREAIATRPKPKKPEHEGLAFITVRGKGPWYKKDRDNPISKEMTKLLKELGYHEPGVGFYALRHTFQTIGEECGDIVAVRFIMGHAPLASDMSAIYRERIDDARLRRVTDFVHNWLYTSGGPS